jgi:hypothetical protein
MVCHGGWSSEGQKTGLLNIPTCQQSNVFPAHAPKSTTSAILEGQKGIGSHLPVPQNTTRKKESTP